MRVSTGSDVLSAPFIEQFAMIFRRGRGRGRDFGGRERGSVRGRGSYGGKQNASEKGPRQCRHCRRSNHISEKCWEKLGQPEWAQLSESDPPASCGTPRVSSSAHPGSSTVVLLREEYDRLCKLEFSQNNLSTTHASASGMHAYTASPQKSWMLDSRASSHMAGIEEKFVSLKFSSVHPLLKLLMVPSHLY